MSALVPVLTWRLKCLTPKIVWTNFSLVYPCQCASFGIDLLMILLHLCHIQKYGFTFSSETNYSVVVPGNYFLWVGTHREGVYFYFDSVGYRKTNPKIFCTLKHILSDTVLTLDICMKRHALIQLLNHDDVIKWKHFPRNWPFVWEIHRSPVNFPHKGQWRGALMFSLIYAWTNDWVNNREAGDLRRQHGHYDVIVMFYEENRILGAFG